MNNIKNLKLQLVLIVILLISIVTVVFLWKKSTNETRDFLLYSEKIFENLDTSSSQNTIGKKFTAYVQPYIFSDEYKGTTLDVLNFGATGNGQTDDTSAINKTLKEISIAGGGKVIVPQSTANNYLISSPLIIYSNTELVIEEGVTITLAPNSNSNMLIDVAHYTNDMTVPSTIQNIAIRGGIWARGNNFGSKNNVHSIILGGDNISVTNATFSSKGGKYAVLIQNSRHFTVNNLYMDDVHSDGVHVQGPAQYGLIQNIKGKAGDDMVSLTPYDWMDYTWGNEGDILDIDIDTIQLNQQSIANGVKVLGGKRGDRTLQSNRVHINNVSGSATKPFMSAIYIGDDNTEPNTMHGIVDNILVENIDFTLQDKTGNSLIAVVGSPTSLEIPKITINNVRFSSDMSALVSNSGKINELSINNVRGSTRTKPSNVILQNYDIQSSRISNLYMSNVNIAFARNGGSFLYTTNPSQGLSFATLKNVQLYNVANFAYLSSTTTLSISNISVSKNKQLVNLNSPAKVTITEADAINASSANSVVPKGSELNTLDNDFPIHKVAKADIPMVDRVRGLLRVLYYEFVKIL